MGAVMNADSVIVALGGDVMTGRGIDQVLPEPLPPGLHEAWVHDARDYVRLAEKANGAIPAPVSPEYPWGDALAALDRLAPDVRIVNLETALTRSEDAAPGKGIHYRMNPAHVGLLSAAQIDACTLANNHVLDWGAAGLDETLATLHAAQVLTAGAGADEALACAPAVLRLGRGQRLLLFAWATPDSGVPDAWAARGHEGGVAVLPALDEAAAQTVLKQVDAARRPGDLVVVSLHWGGNWVELVPTEQRRFARRLIELGIADIVHGHSAHHPLPIEVHAGRPILYGCGDLLNDYEGIGRHGRLRSDVGCVYAVTLARGDGRLQQLRIVPFQLRRFRLGHPSPGAEQWLARLLDEGCRSLGTSLERVGHEGWRLRWR